MRFSVVLVNYESWPLTLRCLESIAATGYEDFEVVVVDNEGKEGGPAPDLPPTARVIRNPTNVGFARACNTGIADSGGEYLILINPDTTVEPEFFSHLERFLENKTDVGIVGPKILDTDGAVQLSARREVGFVSGVFGRTSFLTRLFPDSAVVRRLFPAVGSPQKPTEVDWVSGACMVVRKAMLEEIGGMDPRFFMYFEDGDLCRRARAAGLRVLYLPEVEVTHEAGGSSRSSLEAVWRLHKSAFLYHRKHGPRGPLGLYSIPVLAGLSARALAKLVADYLGKPRS
ncbi:glycosyltransferase family 2 protein [soil metagenome]